MSIAHWAEREFSHAKMKDFCRAVMGAYFVKNQAIDEIEVLGNLAVESGLARDAAVAAIEDTQSQRAMETATQEAVDKGVWGAPFMIFEGEPFWGEDRIDQLDLWIEKGGW